MNRSIAPGCVQQPLLQAGDGGDVFRPQAVGDAALEQGRRVLAEVVPGDAVDRLEQQLQLEVGRRRGRRAGGVRSPRDDHAVTFSQTRTRAMS